MKTEKELLESLLKFINEPIVGHPSREAENRAKRNETLIKTYFQHRMTSLQLSGR